MASIQQAFEEAVRSAISAKTICAPMLERKLAEQGIVLSKKAFRKLLNATFDRGDRNMVFERWRFWKRRSQPVSIVFTDADTQEALRVAQQVLDDLPRGHFIRSMY